MDMDDDAIQEMMNEAILGWACEVPLFHHVPSMGFKGFAWVTVEADDSADGVVDYSEFLAACVLVVWGQCGTGNTGVSASGCQLRKHHERYESLSGLLKLIDPISSCGSCIGRSSRSCGNTIFFKVVI